MVWGFVLTLFAACLAHLSAHECSKDACTKPQTRSPVLLQVKFTTANIKKALVPEGAQVPSALEAGFMRSEKEKNLTALKAEFVQHAQSKNVTHGAELKAPQKCSKKNEMAALRESFEAFYNYWKNCKDAMGNLVGNEKITTLSPVIKKHPHSDEKTTTLSPLMKKKTWQGWRLHEEQSW